MYIFEISIKRLNFLIPHSTYCIQIKKCSSHRRFNVYNTFYELKSSKCKQPLNISLNSFYKKALDFHCPLKILHQPSGRRQNHWSLMYIVHCTTSRIFKFLRSPGIDSKESIPPVYVAGRAGTTTFSYSVPSPHRLFKNSCTRDQEGIGVWDWGQHSTKKKIWTYFFTHPILKMYLTETYGNLKICDLV